MVLRSFPYFVYLPAFGVGLEVKRDSKHTLADFPFPISNNPPQREIIRGRISICLDMGEDTFSKSLACATATLLLPLQLKTFPTTFEKSLAHGSTTGKTSSSQKSRHEDLLSQVCFEDRR
ncbi:hypothetical protein CDAR_487581 [Caerostris darwini]|uniref:Uncharacterized protein n=1 Tax=Caerostris darwini TaxID=1538125 RepID=A0AAV4PQE3_9ARAC|nr:hypothetical protein CDAR_487581 [Caerostris darwini]